MWNYTFKGLLAHKTRFVSTFLAVFLGVAFLAGTLVLTDTIQTSFNDLFGDVYRGTDAYVRSTEKVQAEGPGNDIRKHIDDSLVATVRGVDGVADAQPTIQADHTQVVGSDGKAIGNPGQGAPTFGANWIDNKKLNPFNITEGRAPTADNEVAIDKSSATKGHLKVGDTITVVLPSDNPPQKFQLVGIAKFGTADSPLGASYTMFTLPAAEKYLTGPGKIDAIRIQADPGVSQTEITSRISKVLPPQTEALTGQDITKETQDQIAQNISFISIFFTAFAVVAVVVGGFVIYNTFSIIVAQRGREMALLRSIGAARRQVLTSVVAEALMVGLFASALGVVGGVGVGAGLKALFSALGFDLPATGLVVSVATIVVGMVTGTIVTLLAAIIPAIRASRIPPIAALRDVAVERTAASKGRIITGLVFLTLGVLNIVNGVLGSGSGGAVGIGVVGVLVGTVVLGPVVAKPASRVIGVAAPKVKGVTGSIARENAMRNPRRTAATANALLIGVGIVSLITVLYGSLRTSIDNQISKAFTGDLTVTSGSFGRGGMSPTLSAELNKLPEVDAAAAMRFAITGKNDDSVTLTGIDPATFTKVVDMDVTQGDLSSLGSDGIALLDTYEIKTPGAAPHHPQLGDKFPLNFLETGPKTFTVKAIFHRSTITSDTVVSTETMDANVPNSLDAFIFVKYAPGVSPDQARNAVEAAAKPYPTAKVQDIHELKQTFESRISLLFGLILIMLTLAIVIALLGIANTLRLSVYERTRELGLLRAVGMTRAQIRSSVRWESAIISLFGTVGGLILGFFFGWAVITGLGGNEIQFAPPVPLLVVILVVGAVAGVLAAIRPARKAAKL
ncbi:MAG TPA: FtsX-like permease family protein, partial [Acidimicrobiales bacterium]|nr:FtsX-like permease family protein [Acidimicrobiales bacterium]